MPRPKVKMVCERCGSQEVVADAYAVWDVESQSWELQSTFDKGSYCSNCDGECRIKSVTITENQT